MDNTNLENLETKTKTEIKKLTLAQIRELRKLGLDPALNTMTATKNAEMIDWILDNVYKGEVAEDMPYDECVELALDTYKRAYGREDAIKNS